MLIDLLSLKEKYQIYPKNVLHVGAHKGEELGLYYALSAERVLWVEANKNLAEQLNTPEFKSFVSPTNAVVCEVVGEKDGEIVDFKISNNGQSSSILELGEHSQLFPDVVYCSSEQRQTKTIKTILAENNNPPIDFVNLDIQGAELLALKGFGDFSGVKHIYTEINSREVYQGCALVGQIDEFLEPHGFKRAETQYWNDHPWGDALYIKNDV
jgi:FkbM family methyltransferase